MYKIIKICVLLLFIFFVYSFAIERFYITYPEIEVYYDNLPEEFDGYRIAVISDVHYGDFVPKWWVKKAFAHTMSLNPDMIAGVGDYVRGRRNSKRLREAWEMLHELKARDGVYLVNGNHDHWANHMLSIKLLEESGMSVRHKYKTVKRGNARIIIAGLGDLYEDVYELDESLKGTDKNEFKIVLAHNPDSADIRHSSRVDLYITGHTHGGQIRMPFIGYSPLLSVENKKYDLGLRENVSHEKLFISKGVGYSILPLRFNVYPEIPIIVLRRK